ncbi:phosphotransferase family protein [Mycobacterium sp. E1747]|uniref:phosphotransferase family protein n=1 Tax=Mycobacterium sp. E1747 TaxID=1834128 RepID=UPI0009ED9836|nr:phosphotransferase family protein [Mycobacterium sp. E1747]
MSTHSDDRLDEMVGGIRAGHTTYTEADWEQRLGALLASQGTPAVVSDVIRPDAGSSSTSILFSARAADDPAAPVSRYVARLMPETPFFVRYDLPQQFEIQRYLHSVGLPVPNALWIDAHGEWLGRPGYVMDFVPGRASTAAYFGPGGSLADLDDQTRFARLRTMVGHLAAFHAKTDPRDVPSLAKRIDDCRPIEDEVDEWFEMVVPSPELVPLYDRVRRWLHENAPACPQPVLIHGDFQSSNVLWGDDDLVGILDFEFSRIGARESDLAWQHVLDDVSARFFSGLDIALPSIEQRAAWYQEACGVALENLNYFVTKAAFQMACGVVSFARSERQDLLTDPTPAMNYYNRYLLKLLPEPFELPVTQS